jgi:hypothetical protein
VPGDLRLLYDEQRKGLLPKLYAIGRNPTG